MATGITPNPLTRLQIVTRGLTWAGNPNLSATEANFALNAFLNYLHLAWGWPITQKSASGTFATGDVSGTLPTDFEDLLPGGFLIQLLNTVTTPQYAPPLNEISYAEYLGIPDRATSQNQPTKIAMDLTGGKFYVYPGADQAYPWSMLYEYIPGDIDTTSGGDSTKPVIGAELILIQFVYAWALDYLDDVRAFDEGMGIPEVGRPGKLWHMLKRYRTGMLQDPKERSATLDENWFGKGGKRL